MVASSMEAEDHDEFEDRGKNLGGLCFWNILEVLESDVPVVQVFGQITQQSLLALSEHISKDQFPFFHKQLFDNEVWFAFDFEEEVFLCEFGFVFEPFWVLFFEGAGEVLLELSVFLLAL